MTSTGDAGRPPTPPGSPLCIHGATLVGPAGSVEHPAVLVDAGRIQSIDAGEQLPCPAGARRLDATGLVLAPGFIDLELNGAFGVDFTIAPDRLWEAAAELPRHGVTAFLPTIISSPLATIAAARQALLAGPPPGFVGARPLGLHLEGPCLAPARRGVHDETFLRLPDLQTVATVTSVPARLLNVADRHGVLAPGAVFDAVLLTPELKIVATFIAGRMVHAEDALAGRFADVDADPR